MSDDLDRRIAATLRAHEGPDIDPAPLVHHARRRGHRLRRRRHAMIAGGGAVACAILAAAVLVLPGLSDRAVLPVAGLVPPTAPDQPGAAARPDLVGADPTVVHFTVDNLVADTQYVTWSAGRGTESVEFDGRSGRARFVLARSAATLDAVRTTLGSSGRPQPPVDVRIGDRPGTAWSDLLSPGGPTLWSVRWQPAEGLWAKLEIFANAREAATDAASRVRFDGAHRCVVPFRLQFLPAGARLLECSVKLGPSERTFSEGSLVAGDDSGRWLTIRAQRADGSGGAGGDLTAGPYRVRRQGRDVLEMFVEPCSVEVFLDGWGHGYTEADGLTVLGGYQPARDLDDVDTW